MKLPTKSDVKAIAVLSAALLVILALIGGGIAWEIGKVVAIWTYIFG